MAPSVLQSGGFLFGLIGAVSLIAATALNKWSSRDRQEDVLAGVYIHMGLWEDCETTSSGFTECHPNYGILGFSGALHTVQALMTVGVVLSVLGEFASIFSLSCLTVSTLENSTKAKMTLGAGIMFIIAGVCGVAGASIYAHQFVTSSRISTSNSDKKEYGGYGGNMLDRIGMDEEIPTYRFGPALFVAWIGASVLVVGGVLNSLAFREMVKDGKPCYPETAYKPQYDTRADLHSCHPGGDNRDQNLV